MSVPRPTFTDSGFQSPAESDLLAGVTADIDAAMGGGLNASPTTPQGQLAASETAAIAAANDVFAYITTQVDPAFSEGRMQDGIARIYFIERNPARSTLVQVTCIGAQGVTIPVGATILGADGNTYSCQQAGTFDATGTMVLPFACLATGPIACPAGSLTQIVSSVPGWDAASNLADGVIGVDVETRAAFESRRFLSVAQNSQGMLPSIRGRVLGIGGVLDAYLDENNTTGFVPKGSLFIQPNSIYVCVAGGADADVAAAIWSKKMPGCGYTGNTTVTVYDTSPGLTAPYPGYQVTFQRPSALSILFAVQLARGPGVPGNAATLVKAAIVQAFAGADGGERAKIGGTLYASRYYAPVAALGSWVRIANILIGSTNSPSALATGAISQGVLGITAVQSGVLAVGQTLSSPAAAIPDGTTIVSLGTGNGGLGTYNVSSTTAATGGTSGVAIVASTPSLFEVSVGIDQVPTISPDNIAVTFV